MSTASLGGLIVTFASFAGDLAHAQAKALDAMPRRLWWVQHDSELPAKERKQFANGGLAAMNSLTTTTCRLVGRYVFEEQDT